MSVTLKLKFSLFLEGLIAIRTKESMALLPEHSDKNGRLYFSPSLSIFGILTINWAKSIKSVLACCHPACFRFNNGVWWSSVSEKNYKKFLGKFHWYYLEKMTHLWLYFGHFVPIHQWLLFVQTLHQMQVFHQIFWEYYMEPFH